MVEAAWCSLAVQTGTKPLLSHGCTSLRGGRCARPGLRPAVTLLEAEVKRKNRDEFINATVRVSSCNLFYSGVVLLSSSLGLSFGSEMSNLSFISFSILS